MLQFLMPTPAGARSAAARRSARTTVPCSSIHFLEEAPAEHLALLSAAATRLQSVLGENLYGSGDVELAEVLLDRLRDSGSRLAVAESCSGGLVGAKLTSVPGSSDVFAGGLIAYSDDVKVHDLGVPEPLLQDHGAVSVPVAEAMADGVRRRFRTEAAIAVTGVAGPTGGSAQCGACARTSSSRSRSARDPCPGSGRAARRRVRSADRS